MRPSWLFVALVAAFAVCCALLAGYEVTAPMLSDVPGDLKALSFIAVLLGWVISLCLHEWAHAAVAYASGDTSVVDKGYMTLDPRKYTDPVLSVILPVVFLLIGGIPLPGGAVWIETHRIRSRARLSAVSAAGPAVNVICGLACFGVAAMLEGPQYAALVGMLSFLGWLEVLTALLNLLPIPGLDGFGIIEPFLSSDIRMQARRVGQFSILILFVALLMTPLGPALFDSAGTVSELLGGDRQWIAVGELFGRPSLRGL